MEELIKITQKDGNQAVSARELHDFLEIGKDFSSWIKVQIDRCDFIENIDYQSFTQKGEREIGGTIRIEYALTLDAAKEISMMSQSEKGKQARRYFIECEKMLKGINIPSYQIEDPIKRAERWIEEEKQRQQLAIESKEIKEHLNKLIHNGKPYTSSEIAKECNLKSAQVLNCILSDMNIQYRQNGTWLLYSKYSDKGYVSIKQTILDNGKIIYDRQWTGKGRDFILNLFSKGLLTKNK